LINLFPKIEILKIQSLWHCKYRPMDRHHGNFGVRFSSIGPSGWWLRFGVARLFFI
jgi:hypothetical protein